MPRSTPLARGAYGRLCDEVHVWRIDLRGAAGPERWATLAPDERSRAGRYHFRRDRDRFVRARPSLRAILSRYLKTAPGEIVFNYGAHGKPRLGAGQNHEDFRFNLSHAGRLGLLAVARGREVGIDVECIGGGEEMLDIARRFFTPAEVAALLSVPEHRRPEAFYRCWIGKEAVFKAAGVGLSFQLDRFEVPVGPDEPPSLLSVAGGESEVGRWTLRRIRPWPEYIAAVAAEGGGWRIECWDWPG